MIKKLNNFSKHLINELGSNGSLSSIMHKFLIIVNDNNKLLGTITDGDIRRLLLQGGSIDDSIKKAAMLKPKFGKIEKDKENILLLKSINHQISFLQIIYDL